MHHLQSFAFTICAADVNERDDNDTDMSEENGYDEGHPDENLSDVHTIRSDGKSQDTLASLGSRKIDIASGKGGYL